VDAETDRILRAYAALWAEPDAARRTELIARCLADEIEIIGPGYHLRGHRAVADDAARFHRERPGHRALFASGIDAHSGWARFEVQVVAADGVVVAQGLDIVEFAADRRIRRVITFWGAMPAAEPSTVAPRIEGAPPHLEVHDNVPADLARIVDDGLGTANERAAPIKEVRKLACFARAADGAVIGGAVGRTWGECCNLQQLWVDQAQRKAGLGTRIVRRFEEAARSRGCRTFYLDTFSFQAPGFYRKLGYAPVLEIAGYAPGIVCYTMMRKLKAGE
jgi:GNAT superfamily N-acetyltransferase